MKGLWIDNKTFVRFSEKTSLRDEIATRKRAIDFYSLGMYLPNPDPVLKKQGKDITVYNELLVDSHLGACVKSRKAGVLSLEWGIDRGKAKSRQAKVIESVFQNFKIEKIISEILNAVLYGYQVLEVIWQKQGDYILPIDIVGKPQQWFVFDEENRLKLRTRDNYNGIELPERKFLLVQYESSYSNPYGFPELSRCFWPITFKKGGLRFWVTFTEKYGMPFLIAKHPRGTSQQETDRLADMLEQMVQDAIAVIPDDSSVEITDASGKGASASIYRELIDMCNSEVSKAILGQTLTTQQGEIGSYALGSVHLEVRKDIIESDQKLVEEVFNQLIRWIYELNFSGEPPVFSMWEKEDIDKNLAERDEILTKTGVRFTKRYFQKTYGFEDEDIETGIVPQQQQQFSERHHHDFTDSSDDWISAYMEMIEPLMKDIRETAIDKVANWLKTLKEPPTEEVFMKKIKQLLGSEYDNLDKDAIRKMVSQIYQFYKLTDMLIPGIDVTFGGPDLATIDFLSELDSFYLSKFIRNEDAVKALDEFLKKVFHEDGASIFGLDEDAIREFKNKLSQFMIDLSDSSIRRIIDTAVQRNRNWAYIAQLHDAGIKEIEIFEPTQDCPFCQMMHGKVIKVDRAYQNAMTQSSMTPEEFEEFLKDNPPDITNIKEFVSRGMLPPYHPHCRGRLIKK